MSEKIVEIIHGLNDKAALKQYVYNNTLAHFELLKLGAVDIVKRLIPEVMDKNPSVCVELNEVNEFEFHLTFSGDTLVFQMHTNIFAFPPNHEVNNSKYLHENPLRGYFGVIYIYNFLSDSIKYARQEDEGYLLGRLFINHENHFYMDGQRQLDFLYKDIEKNVIDENVMETILEQSMLYALEFDLYAPPVDMVKNIKVGQKLRLQGFNEMATGKRIGFNS
jgi:hypothetical protein